ncbi:JHBP domain-containing protein, partial [Staphylococcus aureus]|uniref:JHBP domain-containing protein n=1 Tax=Staphylococcus aureus TaxID=1280 RepID=UPI0038B2507F
MVIGAGTGAVAFQQNYKNIKLSGLKKVECEKVEMDLEKNKMVLECSAPQIKLDFDYEIHGKILLLPIYGKG